jgi:hypothetical protein
MANACICFIFMCIFFVWRLTQAVGIVFVCLLPSCVGMLVCPHGLPLTQAAFDSLSCDVRAQATHSDQGLCCWIGPVQVLLLLQSDPTRCAAASAASHTHGGDGECCSQQSALSC